MPEETEPGREYTHDSEFDGIIEKWLADAFGARPSEIPEVLYHYTDAAGLHGLLKSSTLWLTDHRFLNDSTEFIHINQVVKAVLADVGTEGCEPIELLLKSEIISYLDVESPEQGFVFSLTEQGDDLGQWRTYGNDGRGFAVGFSGPSIKKLAEDTKEFEFSKVHYDMHKERASLTRAFSELLDKAKNLAETAPQDLDGILDAAAVAFDQIISHRGAVNKHASFASENEWRLISYPESDDEVKVRLSGDRLVSYLEIPNSIGLRPEICRVGIGPGFKGKEVVDAVKILTRSSLDEIEIYFADTPYRRV